MKRKVLELLPYFVMWFFSIEMVIFVLFALKTPQLLIAYIPFFFALFLLLIIIIRRKRAD
ncbi:MAG: hypothetical protein ACTSRS_08780 [Candidatus Helarchaeota archaeon]